MTTSHEVSWSLDGITVRATLTLPTGDGPFPAVVLVAGGGPRDRDWCSPLLPGVNGSGRHFAEAFADAGVASLRYDKRAPDLDAAENARVLFGKFSMRTHLEELVTAVGVLVGIDSIDGTRIAGLDNSEGTRHVLHYATSHPVVPLVAIVLAAPPGRSVGEVILTQCALRAERIPGAVEHVSDVEAAAARYEAEQPMNIDPKVPDNVKMVLASFETLANLPLARELWDEDAAVALCEVEIPTLVLIGRKDLQIDAALDGELLEQAAIGKDNVTFAYPTNTNHVLKEDTRPLAEVVTAPGTHYNETGTRLDPEVLATILAWLQEVLA